MCQMGDFNFPPGLLLVVAHEDLSNFSRDFICVQV